MHKLIHVTKEGYRVYSLELSVNGRKIDEVHIDPHYEEKHSYLNDEQILNIVKFLDKKRFISQIREDDWEYFRTEPIIYQNRNYRLIWCLKNNFSFLGVRNCYYRRKKYDKN